MSELRPCTACDRHVAIDEESCPFCAAALPPEEPRPAVRGRLSRAALFAGAALAASSCGGSKVKPDQQPPPVASDAGVDAADQVKEPERRMPDRPPNMPYGAPPARRRLV